MPKRIIGSGGPPILDGSFRCLNTMSEEILNNLVGMGKKKKREGRRIRLTFQYFTHHRWKTMCSKRKLFSFFKAWNILIGRGLMCIFVPRSRYDYVTCILHRVVMQWNWPTQGLRLFNESLSARTFLNFKLILGHNKGFKPILEKYIELAGRTGCYFFFLFLFFTFLIVSSLKKWLCNLFFNKRFMVSLEFFRRDLMLMRIIRLTLDLCTLPCCVICYEMNAQTSEHVVSRTRDCAVWLKHTSTSIPLWSGIHAKKNELGKVALHRYFILSQATTLLEYAATHKYVQP